MTVVRPNTVLGHCHKATVLGNSISIHMLNFLDTVKNRPHGFDNLAADFLEVCQIMWSLEAGLNEFTKGRSDFPPDLLAELDEKFTSTHTDFQALDQWVTRFCDFERKGAMGKLQRGWHNMFADNEVSKMRASLLKTKQALRMSAMVFKWSLGEAKMDESVGFGYIGLAAALKHKEREQLEKDMTTFRYNEPRADIHLTEGTLSPDSPIQSRSPPLLQLPPVSGLHHQHSAIDLSPFPTRDDQSAQSVPDLHYPSLSRLTSMSNGSQSSHSIKGLHLSNPDTPHTVHSSFTGSYRNRATESRSRTGETPVNQQTYQEYEPIEVIRVKADPLAMPHWSPRGTLATNTDAHREALTSAVASRNAKLVEQLLDRGVAPDTGPNDQALNIAIHLHDIDCVRLLLLFGADPNAQDKNGISPLLLAVEESFFDGASMLLEYGADPNLNGPGLDSPLAASVIEDKFNFARLLMTYGGDPGHVSADGETILIRAVFGKKTRKMIDLLLAYGSDANSKTREGKTVLFHAVEGGRADIVTSLLDCGANPNLPGPKIMLWPSTYHTPCLQILLARGADPKRAPGIMEFATSVNHLESVRVLLQAGVSPNDKKDGIFTALCTAIRDDRGDIFQLLLNNGADPNLAALEHPAFKCVTHDRVHLLEPLVKAGCDLKSPKGILETAVQHNNMGAVQWLIDAGVPINDKAVKTGATALTTAIKENRFELVDLLLSRGADPNVRGDDWPICLAVRQPAILKRLLPALAEPRAFKGVMEMAVVANQLESIKLLLRAGVSVEDRNGGVFSPLTTAIREDNKEIVKYLLDEARADVNAPGEHLPIVKSLRRMHNRDDLDILEMLLAKGADPNKVYRGHNAVIQALEDGDLKVLKLLVDKAGVDLEARDQFGKTVLELAYSRGDEDTKRILLGAKKIQT
ncbi:putative Ankyrin repeat-containing domain protein [Seiridium cardinale]|uniref:Ankyrin repeat-containing domain protein n=1 Tax=Seiridium cardinale TaxID=138064 RepID=A0ABR2XRF5_9PEZI